MPKTHYKLDHSDASRRAYRDADEELDSAKTYGFYTWKELRIVPLRDIEPQKVWNPPRIERIREGLAKGAALPAVSLARNDSGRYAYSISDGIHRYNASVEAGFTHIPAMVTFSKETPELKEEPKVFREGTYVRFKTKQEGRWEIGYLAKHLFGTVFETVAGDARGAEWVGDQSSNYFAEEVDPPRQIKENIMNHWFFDKTSVSKSAGLPKKVKEYVKKFEGEGKEPGYAYALAWSIYCKHINPDSPSCKADSYLDNQGKTSSADYLYHVTYARNLEGIGSQGLTPGRGSNFGGAYRGHSSGRTFLCDFKSVKFWIGKLWDMAEANSDTPLEDGLIPIALKVKLPRGVELHVDEAGSKDSRGEAYYVEDKISGGHIAYWDGFSYSAASDAFVEDLIEEAKDSADLEDYGDGEVYYDFGYGDHFMPKKASISQRVAARVMLDLRLRMARRIALRVLGEQETTRQAGAPQRERQRNALRLYKEVQKRDQWSELLDSTGGVFMTLNVKEILGLSSWPERTSSRVFIYLVPKKSIPKGGGGYFDGKNKIYVGISESVTEDNAWEIIGDRKIRSILVHELTHYLDEIAGSLWLGEDYDPSDRGESYYASPAEVSAYMSQIVNSVQVHSLRTLRKEMRSIRKGEPLHTLLWKVPELSGWDKWHFTELFENSISDNILRTHGYLGDLDIGNLKKLGKYLNEKQKRKFISNMYQSLEEFRKRELLPEVAKMLRDKPHLLDDDDDVEYEWQPKGPGKRGAKAWWNWLLSQKG